MRQASLAGAVLALTIITLPAQAHTRAELEGWTQAWVEQADEGLSAELVADLEDMRARHPWFYSPQEAQGGSNTSSGRTSAVNWDASAGVEQWRPLVETYFAADQVARAMCIMDHESRGDPNADNPSSTAAGLFQFLRSTWDNMVPSSVTGGSYGSGQVYQPEPNIRSAAWLQAAEGWTQWSPYNRGECR